MPVNLNGMDPRVVAALKQIQEQAAARGIQTNVISGARTYQDQVELSANADADRAGLPLPYPARGHVAMAAAPGSSLHEKGLAFDLQAADRSRQAELESLAPTYGLKTISGDPNHFELAGAGAGPGRSPAGPSAFLRALQAFESGDRRHPERGGRNINNITQGTSSGQAQGYNQITTGTWKDFGGLKYAPTPQQATEEQQNEIASKIPLGRWAPETRAYLRQQGFKVDDNATLAENIANNGGGSTTGSGGAGVAGAAPANGDWQSMLGAEAPPESDLSSMMSDAVAPAARAPTQAVQNASLDSAPPPPVDLSFASATETPEALGARYQAGKQTRKLSPLGELFTLPTIGPPPKSQQPKQSAPYASMGIG